MTGDRGDAADRRQRSYAVGAQWAARRMARERPADAEALRRLGAGDIVVVRGSYDHVERVLDALGLPYTRLEPEALARARLGPDRLLVVNCPGQVPDRALPRVEAFVRDGGRLFTTDWALRHVVEPCFPGIVAYNGRPTRDDVVRVEACGRGNPLLDGVMDGNDDPLWWLEGSSYPIRVLAPERVEVLLRSGEMEERYGEAPIAVLFGWGEGEVLHMASHYYLQRSDLRTERHRAPAAAYAAEKDIPLEAGSRKLLEGLSLAEVESAQTSSRLLANWLARSAGRSTARPGRG